MPVIECEIPSSSALGCRLVESAYFRDSYRVPLAQGRATMTEIFFAIFGHHPSWMKFVLIVRNRIASMCGLEAPTASEITDLEIRSTYAVGDKIGVWPISSNCQPLQPAPPSDPLVDPQPLYHGTRANLQPGDLIVPGYASNYGKRKKAAYVYLSATLEAATWGAELALGEGPGRIYIVEPTGPIADDPNLTDKKFPGNPTKSYRTREPLRVVGEVKEWQGHSPEALKAMKDHIEQLRQLGVDAIED